MHLWSILTGKYKNENCLRLLASPLSVKISLFLRAAALLMVTQSQNMYSVVVILSKSLLNVDCYQQ